MADDCSPGCQISTPAATGWHQQSAKTPSRTLRLPKPIIIVIFLNFLFRSLGQVSLLFACDVLIRFYVRFVLFFLSFHLDPIFSLVLFLAVPLAFLQDHLVFDVATLPLGTLQCRKYIETLQL